MERDDDFLRALAIGVGRLAIVARTADEALTIFSDIAAPLEEWPEVVYEDVLDAEEIGD